MFYGKFGRSNSDLVCVQSMDGLLTVYNHGAVTLTQTLPNFLIPGPITYCSESDSFLVQNACFELECFSYQVLEASYVSHGSGSDMHGIADFTTRSAMEADWRISLTAMATHIAVSADFTTEDVNETSEDIYAVAERIVTVISCDGILKKQIFLGSIPISFQLFPVQQLQRGKSSSHMLVADSNGYVMVYCGTKLLWAFKLSFPPVALHLASQVSRCERLLVTLSGQGFLCTSYLGTEPPVQLIDANFCHGENITENTYSVNNSQNLGNELIQPLGLVQMHAEVSVRNMQLPKGGMRIPLEDFDGLHDPQHFTAQVFVSYSGAGRVENIQLSLAPPAPLECTQQTYRIASLGGGSDCTICIPLALFTRKNTCSVPADQMIAIAATYITRTGEPCNVLCEACVPLAVFCAAVPAIKSASHRVTLNTNRMPPQLCSLYRDIKFHSLLDSDCDNVICLRHSNGIHVTIIVSKKTGRYRLQSAHFGAMWIVARELIKRLCTYFEGDDSEQESFKVSFTDCLPIQDIFETIDRHHATRSRRETLSFELGSCTHQYRIIQKEVLLQVREKNPVSLARIYALLQGTTHKVNHAARGIKSVDELFAEARHALSSSVQMMLLLIFLRFGLENHEQRAFRSFLPPLVPEAYDQGWEELTSASLDFLLRSLVGQDLKRTQGACTNSTFIRARDTHKLKKNISLFCEWIARGFAVSI
jgi:Bardet-Biedl syndrome 9 protein